MSRIHPHDIDDRGNGDMETARLSETSSSSEEGSVFYSKKIDDEESSDDDDDHVQLSVLEMFEEHKADEPSVISEGTTVKEMKRKEKALRKKLARQEKAKNKFIKERDRMKKKVMDTVLNKVLPDIGSYDAGGVIAGPKKKFFTGWPVEVAKLFGCMTCSLHEGVRYMSISSVKKTLKKLTIEKTLEENINSYDDNGRTPLLCAIISKSDHLGEDANTIIDLLLNAGADTNVPDDYNGMTCLMYAETMRDEKLCVQLLSRGASQDMGDHRCVSPLMLAVANNLRNVTSILLSRLADIDGVDDHGWTPLHYGAYAGFPVCLKTLLTNGANRRLVDFHGRTPLDIARFQEDYHRKNPPITKKEMAAMLGVDHGACIAALEDSKSRIADVEAEMEETAML